MLVDTHAHIHFDDFSSDLPEIFNNAKKANLESIVTVGTNIEDSKAALEFVHNSDISRISQGINLYATIGVHPHDAQKYQKEIVKIENLYKNTKIKSKIVAIGECGLDYYKNISPKEVQKEVLISQLELASQLNLAVVFHVRDAWDDFFEIITKFPDIKGVIHSFTGTVEHVQSALKQNLYFGLNGIITFSKNIEQIEAVKKIPIDKIVLETDCPYLAPIPHRGKRNEPAYLVDTFNFLEKIISEYDSTTLSQQIFNNSKLLFSL